MQSQREFFHCGEYLKRSLAKEISEVFSAIDSVDWHPHFTFKQDGKKYEHQAGYNRAFKCQFEGMGWESEPLLRKDPKLIGDFRKELVFLEIQFGNSSTLYRDYYKFQYGLANGLLSLSVLIVPTTPEKFFPTRPQSVRNMAEFKLASTCLSVLPINVPTLLVGLLPSAG